MRVFFSAGDHSADIHAALLVEALRKKTELHVTAVGGGRLQKVSDVFIEDLVRLDVSGFSQPIKQFFHLKSLLQKKIFPLFEQKKIDAVVLVDYYGFNIHVAQKAKDCGLPVYYFVSPQVWASRAYRIQKLKRAVRKMLVIFPFEETLYRKHAVPVEFVGHPLLDHFAEVPPKIAATKLRLGLFPGSRHRELVRHVPLMADALFILQKRFPQITAQLFAVDFLRDDDYQALLARAKFKPLAPIQIVRDKNLACRSQLDFAIAASGTVTLENAILGLPMVVVYQTSWLTYVIAKQIIQVPFISMPNILAGKMVVPELVQSEASPEKVAAQTARYLADTSLLEGMRSELIKLKNQLGTCGTYDRAAASILQST